MAKKITNRTNPRAVIRHNKKIRIRKKIKLQQGAIARLVVYRSNKFLYAQVVNDRNGTTVVQANTGEKPFEGKSSKNLEAAKHLGKLVGERALGAKVERILFDRNGFEYHGRIKALAEGAREAGLQF
ncbi:MAG: 50S ribosomal protein L18 [Proteobacteria bacterium]|nr:50S ribosomal protein L18 [Pseudomonadota bacterium]NDC25218.1 50S ribosomal protein L18 [Pseudomonadota bacterium]NDD05053.1 50S ribosomal protein L18 [Pseudomonadota bacterium]NDG28429.1 50S ribosomal protein L18 [Pseudomonadota bacterium]